MRINYFLALLLVMIAGCGHSGLGVRNVQPQSLLPPLPVEGSGINRETKGNQPVVILGSEYFSKHSKVTTSDDKLLFASAGDTLKWAVFELGGLSGSFYPTALDIDIDLASNGYWLALSCYADNRWEILDGPVTGDGHVEFPEAWQDYSKSGSTYVVFIAHDTLATLNKLVFDVQNDGGLAAPSGLAGTPGEALASFTWDAYIDTRADHLRLKRADNQDMTGAVVQESIALNRTSTTTLGLTPGQDYYFSLTAWDNDGLPESAASNVVHVVPLEAGAGGLSGIWPRKGATAQGTGSTTLIGPPGFTDFISVNLGAASGEPNRTSPVIDEDGRVYAMSRDGILKCYSSDLSTLEWEFDAADHGTTGGTYRCPPHSPSIGANGNIYFVALSSSGGIPAASYLFGVKLSDGSRALKYMLATTDDENDRQYPSPIVNEENNVIVVNGNGRYISCVKPDGTDDWQADLGEAVQVFADPVISPAERLEFPAWHSGIGINEKTHWISLDALSGAELSRYMAFGGPSNILGGVSVNNGVMHVYPEESSIVMVGVNLGDHLADWSHWGGMYASPAVGLDGSVMYQPLNGGELPDCPKLAFCTLDFSTPAITQEIVLPLAAQSITPPTVTGKPAVDGNYSAFLAMGDGNLVKVEFNPAQPYGPTNPVVADTRKLNPADTYRYSSFAIGNEAVYVVSERDELYCIYNALDMP